MSVIWWRLAVLLTVFALAGGSDAIAQDRPLDAQLQTAFDKGELSGLHNVLVIRDGEILAERHFAGIDQPRGGRWSKREHGPDTLHDMRSITKSIVGLLYGIALAEGKVPGIAQNLLAQFPEYADLAHDPRRNATLISHALTMRMGTAWSEGELSYLDRNNSGRRMEYAKDPVRFALDRPMVAEPGRMFVYNSGAVAVVAELIERGVGMAIDTYAAEKLFNPLAITDYEWRRRADGSTMAYTGLRLNVHDLAKIGQLLLQRGQFGGQRIVPSAWLAASFKPWSVRKRGWNYGYLWSLIPKSWRGLPALVAGTGHGGQTLAIQLEHKLIVVIFAGNYGDANQGKLPLKILTEFVVPSLKANLEK